MSRDLDSDCDIRDDYMLLLLVKKEKGSMHIWSC